MSKAAPDMQPNQLRQEVAAVFGEIVAAKRLVRGGRAVELDGLDKRIAGLCEAVILLPGDESRSLLPLLDDLRSSLDELTQILKTASPSSEPLPPS